MPLGQFDERLIDVTGSFLDDGATPGTPSAVGVSQDKDQRFDIMNVSNSDSIAHKVGFSLANSVSNGFIIELDVPAGAGFNGVPPVDLLAAIGGASFHYMLIPEPKDLYWWVGEAINTGKFVLLYASGGYF